MRANPEDLASKTQETASVPVTPQLLLVTRARLTLPSSIKTEERKRKKKEERKASY